MVKGSVAAGLAPWPGRSQAMTVYFSRAAAVEDHRAAAEVPSDGPAMSTGASAPALLSMLALMTGTLTGSQFLPG